MRTDQRLAAFCSKNALDIFHPVTHQNQIWQPDPYDIETIHETARFTYGRLLNRIDDGVPSDSGRILLLLGQSGAGKTHLMRVFRNQTHGQNQGFFSYMQMTAAVANYARYVLRNTIDSFDKPYYESFSPITGLMKLSNALAEDTQVITPNELKLLREDNLNQDELVELIYPIADRIVALERFVGIDLDLIRTLLYLQPGQPEINAKVFKLLRCEHLTDFDSNKLGGMTSRDQEDDPLRMLRSLANLIRAVMDGAFVICLDQLEDIHSMEEAGQRFRQAMQTIVTLAEIPNVIVVVSCLEEFYYLLKKHLPKPHFDRLELDPEPIKLEAERTSDDIEQIISRRLQYLYDLTDTAIEGEYNPLYPFPKGTVDKLSGLPTRRILDWCRKKREDSIATGKEPITDEEDIDNGDTIEDTKLSQHWNHLLTNISSPPDDDQSLLQLLGDSIERCAQEMGNSYRFIVRTKRNFLTTEIRLGQDTVKESLLLGLCQKTPQGGALARQIRALKTAAVNQTPVILRTTEFPNNPRTKIAQQIGQFISEGGRRAEISNTDWRTMAAIQSFQQTYSGRVDYQQWLQEEQPLSRLKSLQNILNLSQLKAEEPDSTSNTEPSTAGQVSDQEIPQATSQTTEPPQGLAPTLPATGSAIPLGSSRTAIPAPIDINPESLVRHGAFLGGSGSGKTTLALALIEQLLLQGIPAILLDRKGDLCSYADPSAWEKPCNDPRIDAFRQLLRDNIEVAVYTPGTIGGQGRPLSIAITPTGLGQMPSGERQQIANYCAMALGGILNYKQSGQDKTRTAILGQAIAVLSELQTDNPLSINRLIDFIAEMDPLLINAIGVLDPKHCKKLAEDLQTLSLMAGHLFNAQHEQLSIEQFLGSNQPQQTQLSIINLGSLGDNANILFWVSQFLLDLNRYAQKHPSGSLQAVVLFDEADLYLPAQGKPSTKEPMENLLKRARSAGIGILLATQSPGDLDYKCRDQISSWFVGKVKENTALSKLKPMLSEAKIDVTSKLANQKVGEFFAIRAGDVVSLKANMSLVRAEQVSLDEILALAAKSAG